MDMVGVTKVNTSIAIVLEAAVGVVMQDELEVMTKLTISPGNKDVVVSMLSVPAVATGFAPINH
jgi:hypothetical protein